MKKLLLLLLLPYFAIAQVSNGRETEFEAIKTTGSQTITTPVYLVTEGVDGTHGKTTATGFEKTANKQNDFTVDGSGVKYPTIDIINSGVAILDGTSKVKLGNINNQENSLGQLPSKNLAIYTTFTAGKKASWVDGNLINDSDTKATDFIKVENGLKYRYTDKIGSLGYIGIAYYDINKVFLSGEYISATDYLFTIPNNACFVRTSFQNSSTAVNRDYFYQSYKFSSYGDSITAQNQWQPLLSQFLGLYPVNVGYGGAPMTGLMTGSLNQDTRLNTIPIDSDIVTVLCGTNDWITGYDIGSYDSSDVTTFSGALNSAFKKIKLRCPNAIVVALTTTYGMYPNYFSNPIGILNNNGLSTIDYATAVKEVAKRNNVKYINTDNLWSRQNIANYVTFDGAYLHPNSSGGAEMASAISKDLVTTVLELKTNEAVNAVASSGAYTPTLVNISNASSLSGQVSYYTNIGNVITLTCRFSITETTANTATSFRVTLPVNRATSTSKGAIGNGIILDNGTTGEKAARCSFDATNNSTFLVNYRTTGVTGSTIGAVTIQYITTE
jgi:lysophospholipase L1-like esterase